MRRARRGFGDTFTFGGRVPAAVGAIIAATVLVSLVGAIGGQADLPLRSLLLLQPRLVLSGQIWRLVTWVFVETNPFGLLFGCLTLYWFGRDLYFTWGERRFVATYFGFGVFAAVVATVLALMFPAHLGGMVWAGMWPVLGALIVAWALYFPERQILLFFALPVSGSALLYVTLGGTVLYAVFDGFHQYVPHLAAELGMLAWARSPSTGKFFERLRMRAYERNLKRRAKHLKVVDRDRDRERDDSRPRWLN
jgi:membrane associated rhomboid family serine protease